MANAAASISWTHRMLWQVKGDVLYNGKNFSEFVVERSSGYVEQTDQHYPPLTVRETIDFAAWCQGTGYREGQYPSSNTLGKAYGKAGGTGKGEGEGKGRGRERGYSLCWAISHAMPLVYGSPAKSECKSCVGMHVLTYDLPAVPWLVEIWL